MDDRPRLGVSEGTQVTRGIGIDLESNGGLVAIGSEVRKGLEASGRSSFERDSPAAVAVPAYFHDGQRREALERCRGAGWKNVGVVVNRPTAAAMADPAIQAAGQATLLVLERVGDRLDVTLMNKLDGGLEVLATEGASNLGAGSGNDPHTSIERIREPVRRALEAAGVGAHELDHILLCGLASALDRAARESVASLGATATVRVLPEHAVALGAAILATRVRRPATTDPPPTRPPVVRESGCLGMAVWIVVAILCRGTASHLDGTFFGVGG